jgi:hypothetical protein
MVLQAFWGSFYAVGRLTDLYLVVFTDVFMRVGVLQVCGWWFLQVLFGCTYAERPFTAPK